MAFPDPTQQLTFFQQTSVQEVRINSILEVLCGINQKNKNTAFIKLADEIMNFRLEKNKIIMDAFGAAFMVNPPLLFQATESCRKTRSKLHNALLLLTDQQLKRYLEGELDKVNWTDFLVSQNLRVAAIAIRERHSDSPFFKLDNLATIWQKIINTENGDIKAIIQYFFLLWISNESKNSLDNEILLPLLKQTPEHKKAQVEQLRLAFNNKQEEQCEERSHVSCAIM